MKNSMHLIAAAASLSASVALAIEPVTVKGNAFFRGDERFYIRGVDYQPGGAASAGTEAGFADPIADVDGCKRDVEKFKELGINTVRVYAVDNKADHDECMSMLADADIYLALDVNTPTYALNRSDPHPSYNDVYLQSIFATIDMFAEYDNTLLFFSGNEVINTPETSNCAPYIKAVTRDMRSYISSQGHRAIPVGYSAADVKENRYETATYLNCGTPDERSDFFAFNDYSWCDPSSFDRSGWDEKVKQYGDYSIPLFLSEYGCIKGERQFGEVPTLYSEQMTPVYSGGLVYEYSEEGTQYGIVKITGDSVVVEGDFNDLKKAFQDTPDVSGDGGYKESGAPSKCPAKSPTWVVSSNLLPAVPEPALKYFEDGAGEGPGANGPGSMQAGTPSKSKASPGSGAGGESSSAAAVGSYQAPEWTLAPFVCGLVVLASTVFGASLV